MITIRRGLLVPLMAGSAVALFLGVYGQVHTPSGRSFPAGPFSSAGAMKSWLTTLVLALVAAQVLTAARLSGRLVLPREAPLWLDDLHRLLGTIAFAVSLPVVFHCLWALGYQATDARVAVHSLVGCAAYGVYAAKAVAVRHPHQPAWALPALGSSLALLFTAAWWTGARWWFTGEGWSF